MHGRAQNDPRVHFGLGGNAIATDLTINWPDGCSQNISSINADRVIAIIEICGKLDHARIESHTCALAGCHDGLGTTASKPLTHPLSSDRCEACHTTMSWLPLVSPIIHSDSKDICSRCHKSSSFASGKSASHPVTTDRCGLCHNTESWRILINPFAHLETSDECIVCH